MRSRGRIARQDRALRGLVPAIAVFRRSMTDQERLELAERDTRRPMERLFARPIVGYTPRPVIAELPIDPAAADPCAPAALPALSRRATRAAGRATRADGIELIGANATPARAIEGTIVIP